MDQEGRQRLIKKLSSAIKKAKGLGVIGLKYSPQNKQDAFYNIWLQKMQFAISAKLKAPAAITFNHHKNKFVLFINPLMAWAFIQAAWEYKGNSGEPDEEFTASIFRGFIKHEILHGALKHVFLSKRRTNHELSNICQDAIINLMVEEMDKHVPNDSIEAHLGLAPFEIEALIKGVKGWKLYAEKKDPAWEDLYDFYIERMPPQPESNDEEDENQGGGSGEGQEGTGQNGDHEGKSKGKGQSSKNDEGGDQDKKEDSGGGQGNDKEGQPTPEDVEEITDEIRKQLQEFGELDEEDVSADIEEQAVKGQGVRPDAESAAQEKMNEMNKEAINELQHGKLKGDKHFDWLLKILIKVTKKRINWRKLLKKAVVKWFGEYSDKRYSYKRPNRRIPQFMGVKQKPSAVKMLVLIDTSGSVSDKLLKIFLEETINLIRINNIDAKIFSYDVTTNEIPMRAAKAGRITITGRGGTSVEAALKEVQQKYPKLFNKKNMLLIFTDTYDDFPDEKYHSIFKHKILVSTEVVDNVFVSKAKSHGFKHIIISEKE